MAMPKRLGISTNPLRRIRELFPEVWPTTIWPIDHTLQQMRRVKQVIADDGTAREDADTTGGATYKTSLGSSKNTLSIFNPQILSDILQLYSPPDGSTVYDPFGGGGARAMAVAGAGYNYIGVELRKAEVDAVGARVANVETEFDDPTLHDRITLIEGSATDPPVSNEVADMLITCPPYWNMEKYNGGPDDLSMASTYDQYLDMLYVVVEECLRVLKPGGLAFWITGLHRDSDGHLLPINRDVQAIHGRLGMPTREEVILYKRRSTTAPRRMGTYLKGRHLLIRNHEYLTIFTKEA